MLIERGQSREYPVNIYSSSEEEGTHAASRSTSGPKPEDENFEALIEPLRQAVAASTLKIKRAQKAAAKAERNLAELIERQESQNGVLRSKIEKAL